MNKTPTTLIIMDGFGLSNDTVGNAVRAANTPVLDGLFAEYAHTTLQASHRPSRRFVEPTKSIRQTGSP